MCEKKEQLDLTMLSLHTMDIPSQEIRTWAAGDGFLDNRVVEGGSRGWVGGFNT